MEIKVLGTGCANCKALYATVEKVVNELGIQAEIIKEEDLMKIRTRYRRLWAAAAQRKGLVTL